MRSRIWEVVGDQFPGSTSQKDRELLMDIFEHWVIGSFYLSFQIEKGCGDHLASVFNALLSGYH